MHPAAPSAPPASPRSAAPPLDTHCGICADTLTDAYRAACGHAFCAQCLLDRFDSSAAKSEARRRLYNVPCPTCKANLRTVRPSRELRAVTRTSSPGTARRRDDAVDDWARVFTLEKHPSRPTPGEGGSASSRSFSLLLLLYIFSPIDFIPDFIPLFGLADDAIALLWLVHIITRACRKTS